MTTRHLPLPSRSKFFARLARNGLVGLGLVLVALAIGVLGYHGFEGMGWIDSFANAAMILSGMGPLDPLHTKGGRVFAGLYAIFSGVAFITTVAIAFAPVVNRFLHRFHLEQDSVRERDADERTKPEKRPAG